MPDVCVLGDERLGDQLARVLRRFDLASSIRLLTRCSACNHALRPVGRRDVAARVPPRVLERHQEFAECPSCDRVYWEGTHAARIRAVVAKLAPSA